MQRRDINAADAPLVGIASNGSIPEDAGAQCALAWQNLQGQLRPAGMEIENLVKVTTIVRNPADVAKVRAGRRRCWAHIGRRAH